MAGDENRRVAVRAGFRAEWEEEVEVLHDVGSRVERFGREWVVADRVFPRKFEHYRLELHELGLEPE